MKLFLLIMLVFIFVCCLSFQMLAWHCVCTAKTILLYWAKGCGWLKMVSICQWLSEGRSRNRTQLQGQRQHIWSEGADKVGHDDGVCIAAATGRISLASLTDPYHEKRVCCMLFIKTPYNYTYDNINMYTT